MGSEIQNWVQAALNKLKITVMPLSPIEGRTIIARAKSVFVEDDPRAWWMSLKMPSKRYSTKLYKLREIIPSSEPSYWFVPETEEESPPVFELELSQMNAVLTECPFFEYYVLHKQYRWLVAESDHNELHVCVAP